MSDETKTESTEGDGEEFAVTKMYGEPFTSEWRRRHAIEGDQALSAVNKEINDSSEVASFGSTIQEIDAMRLLVEIAAASYAAANVRAKPAPVAVPTIGGRSVALVKCSCNVQSDRRHMYDCNITSAIAGDSEIMRFVGDGGER